MALILLKKGERGEVSPGDVVFSETPGEVYPLHVGICVEEDSVQIGEEPTPIEVCSVPKQRGSKQLGVSHFDEPASSGYPVTGIGQRRDVPSELLKEVALLARTNANEHTQFGRQRGWGWTPNPRIPPSDSAPLSGARPIFTHGTCAQFVEFLYRHVGIGLIHEETRDPDGIFDISPIMQMHAFYRGVYPLRVVPWDPRLTSSETCIFGEPDPKA